MQVFVYQMLVVAVCALVGAFSAGVSGFGQAIMFQLVWLLFGFLDLDAPPDDWDGENTDSPLDNYSLIGNIRTAVACLVFLGVYNSVGLGFHAYRKKLARREMMVPMLAAKFMTFWLGTLGLRKLEADLIKRIIGVVFILTSCFMFSKYMWFTYHSYFFDDTSSQPAAQGGSESESAAAGVDEDEGAHVDIGVNDVRIGVSSCSLVENEKDALLGVSAVVSSKSGTEKNDDANNGTSEVVCSRGDAPAKPDVVVAVDAPCGRDEGPGSVRVAFDKLGKPRVYPTNWRSTAFTTQWPTLGELWSCRVSRGAFFTGLISGLLTGAFGTGGPPIMIFLSFIKDVTKEEIRGTFQCNNLISMPMTFAVTGALGVYDIKREWPLYLLAPLVAFVGVRMGKALHRRVHVDHVRLMLHMLVLVASLSLVGINDGTTTGDVFTGVYVVIGVFVIVVAGIVLHARRKHVKAIQESSK